MSYYEFIISGDLSPEFDDKIKIVMNNINTGRALYSIQKYTDEDVAVDKKRRTVVLVSPANVWNHIYDIFKGCGLEFQVYFKQRVV
jgi:hypothetical protein